MMKVSVKVDSVMSLKVIFSQVHCVNHNSFALLILLTQKIHEAEYY